MMMVSGWGTDAGSVMSSVSPEIAQRLGQATPRHIPPRLPAGRQHAAGSRLGLDKYCQLVLSTQMAAMQRDQEIAAEWNRLQQQMQQARQSLAEDIQTVESWNAGIREVNDRVLPIVKTVTGQDFGTDRDAWLGWWNDQLGYAYQSPKNEPKPTYTELVVVPMNQHHPLVLLRGRDPGPDHRRSQGRSRRSRSEIGCSRRIPARAPSRSSP